ncbi:unnamed protein product, partial [Onchocerca flexuosa]|uniref:Uncharacterized protein n=1 Tax=Onchocerca flexuosa TaxID=387005 RepID=A0A183H3R8_9BILA
MSRHATPRQHRPPIYTMTSNQPTTTQTTQRTDESLHPMDIITARPRRSAMPRVTQFGRKLWFPLEIHGRSGKNIPAAPGIAHIIL